MGNTPRRNLNPIQPLIPREAGLRAHVFRVAALARRAAESLEWPVEDVQVIESSGLLHHLALDLLDSEPLPRLLKDLGIAAEAPVLPERVASVLHALRGATRMEDGVVAQAASLIESANLFDEQIENSPYEERSTEEALEELIGCGILARDFVSAIDSFHVVSPGQLLDRIRQLPVFSKAALQAMKIAEDPGAGLRDVERVISTDPVLAGEVLQVANSGIFGASQQVSTLSAALARIGMIAAGKLIGAAGLRRYFLSGELHGLWVHSIAAAEAAAELSRETTGIHTGEAYLAGLVHDVGRIVFESSPAARYLRQWEEAGFPAAYAELLVSGTDHAALGAEVLRIWNFPPHLIEAVRFHHSPEKTESRIAALLFSAEDLTETLPSCARDFAAAQRLEMKESRIQETHLPEAKVRRAS